MVDSSSTAAPTRDARLACACNCAYGISAKTGDYTPPAIYDAGVGWLQPPVPVSAPEAGDPTGPRINACLVGLSADGIVAAMRGTLPPAWTVASLEDWWQDIVDSAPIDAPPLPGKVHEGFWHALQTIWSGTLAEINALRAAHPDAKVYVTGHSKGGPLASIGAARLALAEGITVQEVVTFASPHPGDGDFVNGYPAAIPVTRFENYLDLVPFLPPTDTFYKLFHELIPQAWRQEFCGWFPSVCKALENAAQWNYTSLGELSFVTEEGTVVGQGDWHADPYLRLGQILLVLFRIDAGMTLEDAIQAHPQPDLSESGLARIGAAHCIGCKSESPSGACAGGYMTGAGGDPICPPAAA